MFRSRVSRLLERFSNPLQPATIRRVKPFRPQVEGLEERMLLNNRFVVPVGQDDNLTKFTTLKAAFATPGLSAGAVIQIEANSNPGVLFNGDFPELKNLTIQGNPNVSTSHLPAFALAAVTIDAARQGFTLRNVQFTVEVGTLTIAANSTIDRAVITNFVTNGSGIKLNGTSAAVISNAQIFAAISGNVGNDVVQVVPAAGSHNVITDCTFNYLDGKNLTLLAYSGGAGINDVVAHNSFLGKSSPGSGSMIVIRNGTNGLTFQANTLFGTDLNEYGIEIDPSSQNIKILNNDIAFPNGFIGIELTGGNAGTTTSATIANNRIATGTFGIGIDISAGSPGSILTAKIEGNDFHDNEDGLEFNGGSGGPVTGIDIGGGGQGSHGANNFRGSVPGKSFAINFGVGLLPLQARMNIFGVASPQTVVDTSATADVVTTSPLTGNAAYVQTLYLDFLHRVGDLSNASDAGFWVTSLGQGMSAGNVANAIAHSPDSLGIKVDGLFHDELGRDADLAGRTYFVNYLQAGGTLEDVTQALLTSAEYQGHVVADADFVRSLYQNLFQRGASNSEVNYWVAKLAQQGRGGVAKSFLFAEEYRSLHVDSYYSDLLHRTGPVAANEVSSWVNSSLDILAIEAAFAGTSEFQLNG